MDVCTFARNAAEKEFSSATSLRASTLHVGSQLPTKTQQQKMKDGRRK
jgi:hypothetical protein